MTIRFASVLKKDATTQPILAELSKKPWTTTIEFNDDSAPTIEFKLIWESVYSVLDNTILYLSIVPRPDGSSAYCWTVGSRRDGSATIGLQHAGYASNLPEAYQQMMSKVDDIGSLTPISTDEAWSAGIAERRALIAAKAA